MNLRFALVLGLLTATILGSGVSAADLEAIKKKAELVALTTGDDRPNFYIDTSGKPAGFEAEMCKLIAAKIGVTLNLTPMAWEGILPSLSTGRTDVVCSAVNMVLGKQRKAYINAKPWKLRPLATVEQEINRIAELVGTKGASSSWTLVPLANAAGVGGGASSIAAFAYANSTNWKGESCTETNLSDEQQHDCPLMAVSMTVEPQNMGSDVPIGLQCPSGPNGDLAMTYADPKGGYAKLKISYSNNEAVEVSLQTAYEGESFHQIRHSRMATDTNNAQVQSAMRLVNFMSPVKEEVCSGSPAAKQEFLARLNANKEKFRKHSKATGSDAQ